MKKKIRKFWNFLWHEDSPWSWIVNLLIAFLLVKFLIYPGLSLVFGTSLPIVAVISGSMEHDGSFDEWWVKHEDFYLSKLITKQQFQMYPLKNGFDKGDVIILIGTNKDELQVGEVIVFQSQKPYPIIHRVVDKHENYFETKGDNNIGQNVDFDLNEKEILPEQIIGKAVFRIPYLGWIKIAFTEIFRF